MKKLRVIALILAVLTVGLPTFSACKDGTAKETTVQKTDDEPGTGSSDPATTVYDTTGAPEQTAPFGTDGSVTAEPGYTSPLTTDYTTSAPDTDSAPDTTAPGTTANTTADTTTAQTTTAGSTTTAGTTTKKTIKMYDDAKYDSKAAVEIASGSYIAQHFSTNNSFDNLTAWCPSWSNNIGNMKISLYKFNTSIAKSITGTALASKTFVNYNDNAYLSLDFAVQGAGDYVLLFSDTTEQVGVWLYPSSVSGSIVTDSGVERSGEVCLTMQIRTESTPYFNTCKSDTDSGATVTTPPEPTLSADDILVVRNAQPDTWVATDGLGRVLPTNNEVGNVDSSKFVGMFYWTWHVSHSKSTAPHNIQNVCDTHPEAIADKNSSVWADVPYGTPCFWNEPIYGYYTTTDKWVLRKHAELLAAAGVDVVIFDNTNGTFTWRESYLALLDVWEQARKDGVLTPKISFILPFWDADATTTQLREIYQTIYRTDRYRDLWFYWQGKPLMMALTSGLDRSDSIESEIYNFFTFRQGVPEYNGKSKKNTNSWGWLAVYPQAVYTDSKGIKQTTVGVAMNWGDYNGGKGLTAMNGTNVFGRTYTSKGYDTRENAKLYGANFAEQWEYALKQDVDFVFVTGWNEWVAGRHESWQGVSNAFPDEFNDEFSRDIEPSTGELKDHYYYQLVSYIRKYKGVNKIPTPSAAKTINLSGAISQWDSVSPYYIDYKGDTFDRDSDGYLTTHYTNTTGRNDIVGAKVARDADYLYFMVECADNITSYTDSHWMRLLIDTGDSTSSWEGFEYVLNRTSPTSTKATLEKSTGGWSFKTVGTVDYKVSGKYLAVKIPKTMLGITADSFTVNFKWNDNMQKDGDIMDFYSNGDTAPLGRFMYSYVVK